MKYLITGNLKILAPSIGRFLLGKNHQVVFSGYDDQEKYIPLKDFQFVPIDRKADLQRQFFDAHSFDCVIYILAQEGMELSSSGGMLRLETIDLENVLSLSERSGVNRVILISSIHIYGDGAVVP